MKISINNLTPELFLELYTAVGWEVSLELSNKCMAVKDACLESERRICLKKNNNYVESAVV